MDTLSKNHLSKGDIVYFYNNPYITVQIVGFHDQCDYVWHRAGLFGFYREKHVIQKFVLVEFMGKLWNNTEKGYPESPKVYIPYSIVKKWDKINYSPF